MSVLNIFFSVIMFVSRLRRDGRGEEGVVGRKRIGLGLGSFYVIFSVIMFVSRLRRLG